MAKPHSHQFQRLLRLLRLLSSTLKIKNSRDVIRFWQRCSVYQNPNYQIFKNWTFINEEDGTMDFPHRNWLTAVGPQCCNIMYKCLFIDFMLFPFLLNYSGQLAVICNQMLLACMQWTTTVEFRLLRDLQLSSLVKEAINDTHVVDNSVNTTTPTFTML